MKTQRAQETTKNTNENIKGARNHKGHKGLHEAHKEFISKPECFYIVLIYFAVFKLAVN